MQTMQTAHLQHTCCWSQSARNYQRAISSTILHNFYLNKYKIFSSKPRVNLLLTVSHSRLEYSIRNYLFDPTSLSDDRHLVASSWRLMTSDWEYETVKSKLTFFFFFFFFFFFCLLIFKYCYKPDDLYKDNIFLSWDKVGEGAC